MTSLMNRLKGKCTDNNTDTVIRNLTQNQVRDEFFQVKNSRNHSKSKLVHKHAPKKSVTQILTPEPNKSVIHRKSSGNEISQSQGQISFLENGTQPRVTRKPSMGKGAHAASLQELEKARQRSSSEVFKEAARLRQAKLTNEVYYKMAGKKSSAKEKDDGRRDSSISRSQTQLSAKHGSNYQRQKNMYLEEVTLQTRKEGELMSKTSTSKNFNKGFSANIFGRRLYTEKMANENMLSLKRKWKNPVSKAVVENSKSKSVSTVAPERGSWKSNVAANLEDDSTMVRLAVNEDLKQTKGLMNRLKTLHLENEAIKGLIGASIKRIPAPHLHHPVKRENLSSVDVDLEKHYRELILKTTQLYKEMFQQP
jgi:hypothetical protein